MAGIGSTPSLIVGIAAGGAASAAFDPALEVPKQQAWASAPNRLPDLALIAQLVAAGQVSQASAHNMANRLGYSASWLDSFTYLAQTTPSFAELLRMWRLGAVNPAFADIDSAGLIDHALAHEGLDWDYRKYLRALQQAEIVGLGDVALCVVRGALPAPAYVPVPPPTSGTTVPRFPQVNIDPEALAAALGFDKDMLHLMIARSGLSLAPGLAAQANFRKLINGQDFILAVAEGDLRTEWAQTLLDVSRAIPSPGEYAELWLRGWLTQKQAEDGAARHGMVPGDTDLLYQLKRRPLNPHQIKQALARGGTFDTTNAPFADPYLSSVHEANLGPEWYDLAITLQGSYPSLFITNRLVTAGTIDAATGQSWLERSGLADEVVTAMVASWGGGGPAKGDQHVTKAETQLWTTTHRSYVASEIDDATATAALQAAGVAAASIPAVLALWKQERSLVRKQLTPTEIRKAVSGAVLNPATGVAWTHADALAALLARGYDQADAETFLAE